MKAHDEDPEMDIETVPERRRIDPRRFSRPLSTPADTERLPRTLRSVEDPSEDYEDDSDDVPDEAGQHASLVADYVAPFIAHRERYLEAVRTHGSPLYLFDQTVLADRIRRFRTAFEAHLPGSRLFYAMKSNPHPAILGTIVERGCGLDVSSGLELEIALAEGARDIIFSGPGKTDEELRLAIQHNDRVYILIDSFGELDRLIQLTDSAVQSVRVGVRLTTEDGGLWRKFGISADRLREFSTRVQGSQHVHLQGIQFHSSWNLTPDRQVAFIHHLDDVLSGLPSSIQQAMQFIDIGGGYWPPPGEWLRSAEDGPVRQPAATIERFAQELAAALEHAVFPHVACSVWLEPGRWLCNDAMHIILTVVDRKAPDLVITDAGINAIGWERFEHDYFPVINLTRPDIGEQDCMVMGSLCTPHDIWGYGYCGTDIQPGDVLLIPNQGAYTYSLRQEFIKRLPRAAVLPSRAR